MSGTADQRLNALLDAAEQQMRESEAAAARARIFGTDHLGQQEHNAFTQCHPNGSASANVITQCNPNGSASSSSAPQVYGQRAAMPSHQIGGVTAGGSQMMADGALAEQMAVAGWVTMSWSVGLSLRMSQLMLAILLRGFA